MTPDGFATRLADMAPTLLQYTRLGVSEKAAERIIRSFRCVKRDMPLASASPSDPIMALIAEWDLSQVRIGTISFLSAAIEYSDKWQIGVDEADPMFIIRATGEIVVEDHACPGYIICPCAKSSSCLLEGLLLAAKFIARTSLREIPWDDAAAARLAAQKCACSAGGDKYLQFFLMLLE